MLIFERLYERTNEMRIALCDDDENELQKISELIKDYSIKKYYDIAVETFSSPNELLKRERFDLYFLDYIMDEMNGLELAKELNRNFSDSITVCYLTSYEAAAIKIINGQVYADGFLMKPVVSEELYEKIDRFYKMSFGRRLELKQGRSFKTVYTNEIYYIEASGKSSIVHYADGSDTFSHMLSEIESLLSSRRAFCRIHRSFIVNMMHVESYDSKSVTLTNGDEIPLKNKKFRDVYGDYILSRMN